MNILILAEHDNQTLKAATLSTITAAKKLSGNITLLVAGYECESVAKASAKLDGVDKVLWSDAPHYAHVLAENIAALMQELCRLKEETDSYEYILAPATTYGKNILPRLAALLNVAQISEITEIVSMDTFMRPTYAGNVIETVQTFDPVKVITVRATSFEKTQEVAQAAPIEKITALNSLNLSRFLKQEERKSKRPDLNAANIVISGGRGLQTKENFKLIEEIAEKLGAAIGASRAAVDAGLAPNDYQVGQTGKVVAPELYIAIGISGAIQHIAGMKDSKVIVAINKDKDAAIFEVCDYYLVGDLFEILPALKAELNRP